MTLIPPAKHTLRTSVVVCTYNGAKYVTAQLRSLLEQSRAPDEIIICDDNSSDGTWELIRQFIAAAEARHFTVHAIRRLVRLGYVGNFSHGLAGATGDLVFLCDQDDVWHPDKIAIMSARFESEPDLLFAHSDARLVNGDGGAVGHDLFYALEVTGRERRGIRSGDAFVVYLRRNLATGAAAAFRRSLLDVALPLPEGWVHDAWLATLAAAFGRIDIVEDALIDYRQHGANQIGVARRTSQQRTADMFRARNHVLKDAADHLGVLIERLGAKNAAQRFIDLAFSMRDHLRHRVRMGSQPSWRRIGGVTQELLSGRYSRFGTGLRSAARDLLRIG